MQGIRPDMNQQLIINFHGIGSPHSSVEAAERPFWIRAEDMSRILRRTTELRDVQGHAPNRNPEILITFDDGNISDLKIALPELLKNNLKATFFVCVGRMNDPNYLNPGNIRELLSAGMAIGNHGMHQRNLTNLSNSELEIEITVSGKLLSDIAGEPISEVAIPYGMYNRRVLNWLQSKPITRIYTSDRGLTSSELLIKSRESITSAMVNLPLPDQLFKPLSFPKNLRNSVVGAYKRWR
jgi:peptidoglycan/xylan/chitin deacetylase (PgdA/CDA1 family)